MLNKEVNRLDHFEAPAHLRPRNGAFDDIDAAISWPLTSAIEAVEPMHFGVDYSRNRPFVCGQLTSTVFTVACCFKRALPLEVSLELGLRKLL